MAARISFRREGSLCEEMVFTPWACRKENCIVPCGVTLEVLERLLRKHMVDGLDPRKKHTERSMSAH